MDFRTDKMVEHGAHARNAYELEKCLMAEYGAHAYDACKLDMSLAGHDGRTRRARCGSVLSKELLSRERR